MAEECPEETFLTPDDAQHVFQELISARDDSYRLGLKLGLPNAQVEEIHSTPREPVYQLRDVIGEVLKRGPSLTWRDILDALRSVGLATLANAIEADRLSKACSPEQAASAKPPSTAPVLYETLEPDDAAKILEELLAAQNYAYQLGLKLNLPQSFIEAIYASYSNPRDRLLHIILEFLQQAEPRPTWRVILEALRSRLVNLPALARRVEAAHSQSEPTTSECTPMDQGLAVSTPLKSDEELAAPDTSTPLLQAYYSATTVNDVNVLIRQLEKKFNQLKKNVKGCIEKHGILTVEVADALTSVPPMDDDCHKVFLQSRTIDLFEAANHSQIFSIMNVHWNYLNPDLLGNLVRSLDLNEVKDQMDAYMMDLQRFREKTPLALFCQTQKRKSRRPTEGFREMVAEIEWPQEVTLEDVEQFRQEYASQYSLHECAMMVAEILPY